MNLCKDGELDYIDIQVEPNSVPISYRGHYHYRSGSTKQELKGIALQEFILRKMGRSWDDIAHPKATEDAIDRDAIDYFLKKGINSGRIDMGELQASIQMHVYNDRIEVWNEGLLPAGYTSETLLSRHSSRPRTRTLLSLSSRQAS